VDVGVGSLNTVAVPVRVHDGDDFGAIVPGELVVVGAQRLAHAVYSGVPTSTPATSCIGLRS
jgi:hypothetical protein